ncbi:MAG: hypothetical protein AAB393_08755 [Bacteroidota bacterium]
MSTTAFDQFAVEYDEWFDAHPSAYLSEIFRKGRVSGLSRLVRRLSSTRLN